jgi:hypothetical protein
MTQILVDSIANITLHAGLVRVDCVAAGPSGKTQPSGTLLIPGAVAGQVLQSLIKGTQEIEKKLREQAQAAPVAGKA